MLPGCEIEASYDPFGTTASNDKRIVPPWDGRVANPNKQMNYER